MKNSSLLSSARPIIFLQNENVDGAFLRRFLVKKLDVFRQHAAGEAYLFFVRVLFVVRTSVLQGCVEMSLRV